MAIISGCFLFIEEDLELSEIVFDDWRAHSNDTSTEEQLVFVKGTRAALCELHQKKRYLFEGYDMGKIFWTRNKRITEDDAFLITVLFNFCFGVEGVDYEVSMFNAPTSAQVGDKKLGWNIRRLFEWLKGDSRSIGVFHEYHGINERYDLSDWLNLSIQESIEEFYGFYSRMNALLRFENVDVTISCAQQAGDDCLQAIKAEASLLKKDWLRLRSGYDGAKSEKIENFIDFSVSSTSNILDGCQGASNYFLWKSVVFGAKARALLQLKSYDHAYLWCHRSLEEYLKSIVVKLDKAHFKGEKFWWNGEPVLGVMKYLDIVSQQVFDSRLYDDMNSLKPHIALRNSSTIGHGSQKIAKEDVSSFIYKVTGVINVFNSSSRARVTWLERVKNAEALYGGEILEIFSSVVTEKAGIVPLEKLFDT